MINRNHSLSLVKQCQTLALARSGVYYQPRSESDANPKLMRLIDEIRLKRPFLSIRCTKDVLHDMGDTVNRKHQTLKTTPNKMCGIVEDLKLEA